MRKLKLATLLAALTLTLAACGGSGTPGGGDGEGGTIKIGSIHPLTGGLAGDGQQMANAVKLAVEDVNAAGGIASLDGAKLEVLDADSQGKPEVGQSEAQRLIQEGAVALVGPYQSAVATNVAAVAERNQVPFVIDVAVADQILDQGYRHTFRIQPNASAMGTAGARYLKEVADASGTPVGTVGYLYENSGFGESVLTAFKAEASKLGIEVDPAISYAASASDLTTEVTRIKAAGVDVLAVTGYYNDSLLIARNVASVRPGVKAVFGVANGAYDLPQFPGDAGQAGAGYFDSNYHLDVTNPDTQALMTKFKDKYGDDVRTGAVLAYEAVRVIADALERAGSREPAKVRDAIAATDLDTLMAYAGPIQFDDSGENKNAVPILMQVSDGVVKQVHPQRFAEQEARFPAPPAK